MSLVEHPAHESVVENSSRNHITGLVVYVANWLVI